MLLQCVFLKTVNRCQKRKCLCCSSKRRDEAVVLEEVTRGEIYRSETPPTSMIDMTTSSPLPRGGVSSFKPESVPLGVMRNMSPPSTDPSLKDVIPRYPAEVGDTVRVSLREETSF